MARILIVDDERKLAVVIAGSLRDEGHAVDAVFTGTEALERIAAQDHDIVLTDLRMPGADGIAVLQAAKRRSPRTEVVLMTAHASAETAVAAMKEGAFDYLLKPFSLDALSEMLGKILRKLEARPCEPAARESGGAVIGRTPEMIQVFKLVGQIAPKDITVMIRGESGTGKELVARAIHDASPRNARPFITINCTALPENLFENELFGHDREAFTGASSRKTGKFEAADGGSLFLDEIGDLSMAMQGKLLRVLEQKSFHRVGGTEDVHVDVRIIAATNVDMETAVQEKRFRQDLYYRLHVFPVWLPPLRKRKKDIPALAAHFLRKNAPAVTEVSPEAMALLMDYPWPGNVRELENAMISASLRCQGPAITPEDLPPSLSAVEAAAADEEESEAVVEGEPLTETLHLGDMEKRNIAEALEKSGGNKTKAAKLLGITRRSLYSKLGALARDAVGEG